MKGWTVTEIRTLKRLAGIKTARDIAELLGRTRGSIMAKAARDDIPMRKRNENHHNHKLSDLQVEMLRTLADAGFQLVDIRAACFSHVGIDCIKSINQMKVRNEVSLCV